MRTSLLLAASVSLALASCDTQNETGEEANAVDQARAENVVSEVTPTSNELPQSVPASAPLAQPGQVSGQWECVGGAGDGIVQTLPPAEGRIDTKIQYFAPRGSLYQVALARGGPTGMFVRGHLHGIHNDRSGRTHYAAVTMIRDNNGFYYAALPPLRSTVSGSARRPQQHQHCGGQFVATETLVKQLNMAIQNGASIQLDIAASRNRRNTFQTLNDSVKARIERYLNGEISEEELLRLLNAGAS